ncbi:MAG: IPT/TIG domain-containing protein [Candidatus Uhrbacteria bacterium]|nr:IPT/TIG domain-containing protein [Candidatus Uhrbacteria bacterium]
MNLYRLFKSISILAVLVCTGIFFVHPVFAVSPTDSNAFSSFAASAGFAAGPSVIVIIARLIRTFISFLGVIAVIIVLYGGFMYMTAGGNDERVKKAKKIILNGIIGLVIVLLSFTIAQFIVGKLVAATSEADISAYCLQNPTDPTCKKSPPFPPAVPPFTLNPPTSLIQCAAGIRNLKLVFVFSKSVKDEKGITVKQNGADVPGTFSFSGSKIMFVPDAKCDAPNDTLHCFAKDSTFHVEVDSTKVKSSNDIALTCKVVGGVNPCSFNFTTGSSVDVKPPQEVSFVDPKDGAKAILGLSKALQVKTVDDSGVASVDFFAIDGSVPINISSTPVNPTVANGLTTANFNGVWVPVGLETNAPYSVWATATDCAGNTKTSSKVSLMLRAPNCDNSAQDAAAPYGETGSCKPGEACDCGGSSTSPFYCGLCKPSACTNSAECSSGYCIAGKCQDVAVIQSVSPDNGAVNNLVTITGSGFGTVPGTIDFLGTEKENTTKSANAYQCGASVSWSPKEIVVQIPAGSIDGPLKVNIPAVGADPAQSDRTDDAVGPAMSLFDVNAIKRPGLCSVAPVAAEVNTPITLTGLSFGSTQGSSSIYLSSFEAKATNWTGTVLGATVPGVESGKYDAQVFTGDYFCLNASGVKVNPAVTCFSNDDCTKVDPAYTCGTSWCSESLKFCQNNSACGVGEGKCVDVRVGSNTKSFVATNTPSASKPVIKSIDPSRKLCYWSADQLKPLQTKQGLSDTNFNSFVDSLNGTTMGIGSLCSADTDCSKKISGDTYNGVCKEYPNTGGPGQYITIYGLGFGTAKGTVKFTDANEYYALGDVSFPDACGKDYWHDDHIIVKVPKSYSSQAGDLTNTNYNVTVSTQGNVASDPVAFHVYPQVVPGPSICSIVPSSGPIGTSVSLIGENFGLPVTNTGYNLQAVFTDNQQSKPGSWANTLVSNILVPATAKSGPVHLEFGSNSLNFTVGNCKTDSKIVCSAGQTCCANGTCSLSCDDTPKISHFAYKVSTSPFPVAPTVVVNCSDPKFAKPSPSPSPLWSKQDNICVTSAVTASFSVAMDPNTLTATNIKIQKCTSEANGVCANSGWQDVVGAFQVPSAVAFQWAPTPPAVLDANTLYQVTIKGASAPGGGVKSKGSGLTLGVSMAQDFSWQFRTSASNKDCGIGSVAVSPANYLATNASETIGYLSQLLSNQDSCIVLSCNPYKVRWNSDTWNATFAPSHTLTVPDAAADPALGSCSASVFPDANTIPGFPAHISSVVINDGKNPHATGTGNLNIALTNPKVSDYFPNCSSACGNAMPWVTFNVAMNPWYFSNAGAIRIFKCQNSLCDQSQETFQNIISGITYDAATYKAKIGLNTSLTQNTWYRIVVSGTIKSGTQAPLSNSGSNFGTSENKFFSGDFSWRFKTKDSAISCVVDRVGVSPKTATLNYVGQRQEYSATAFGAPDDCSVTGQALQSTGWGTWGATDTPNKIGAASYVLGVDHKLNEITTFMLNEGSLALASTLPKTCAANCLFTGNPINVGQAVCGNSSIENGESCDDGNTTDGDGCSSICLKEGTVAPTCGNGAMNTGEQCDDGNTIDGDGCSSKCLFEGATSIKSVCGDGVWDHTDKNGGEACDDGNTKNGDGCNSNCLLEGGVAAYSSARCGDGSVGVGETCDDGNTVDGDGCSSICLNEGTVKGTDATKAQCGNGVTNVGEDSGCDLGVGSVAPGCSTKCLKLGSSPSYPSPSICGNGGALETGEQCEAAAGASYVAGPYGVAEVSPGASVEVEKDITKATFGYAISNVSATVGGKTGVGEFKLLCSCEADNQCGTKSGDPTKTLGCGASKCCYERPAITASAPGDNATGVCRNTAISFTFDQEMDANSFGSVDLDGDGKISTAETDPNLQLELITMKSALGVDENVTAANCPYYAQPVGFLHAKNLLVSAWNWIKGLFGQPAMANATTQCYVPTTYEQDPATHQVYLRYTERLLPLAKYKLTVKTKNGNAKGILSKNQVSICLGDNGTACQSVSQTNTFTTGSDICLLDVAQTTDEGITPAPPSYLSTSPGYYSKTNETHNFSVKPLSYRKNTGLLEEITSIPNVYSWTWSWGAPVKDTGTNVDILGTIAVSTTSNSQYKALGKNGSGDVIATATITSDAVSKVSTTGSGVSGHVSEVAFLCENPWPDLAHGVPFVETGANTNFSLFYCRDIGKPGEGKMLPVLALPPTDATPDQKIINTNVLKELVFHVEGTKDSIGVRVLSNPKYLSPLAWFQSQGFTGTPKTTTLDGYEAVQTGTTIYAAAANRNGSNLYSNIYVVSFNSDAGKDAQDIFDLVLKNFHLNANDTGATGVSHVGLCMSGNAYTPIAGPFVACSWDGDCLNQCKPEGKCSVTGTVCDPKLGNTECAADPNAFCDADKQKLIRDTKRLTDMTSMVATFEKYGSSHGHCSVTKNQTCSTNAQCSGTETCVPGYPTVQSGTFIPSMSNSIWPSWNSTLGNAVGGALPTDPLNQYWAQCKNVGAGYDSATCWNSTQGKFVCPDGSHVYGYQNQGGEDYTLSTELEYGAVAWVNKIDQSASDHATIQASYGLNKSPAGLLDGFTIAPQYCNATTFGSSTICGDGVKGVGEACEKGEVKSIACAAGAGFINVTCKSDCSDFQDEAAAKAAGATCKPFACGNGVKDPGETCDDGALNGTYGHCGANCTLANAFSCGDGYLAGNEQCDCGTPTNFSTLAGASWAKSNNHCDTYNGGYSATGKNCTVDCKLPGPMCSDAIVNDSSEVCDKSTETYAGALNADGTKCNASSGCAVAACTKSKICTAGTNIGSTCTTDLNCPTDAADVCASDTCVAKKCSASGKACGTNADCVGKCSVSGKLCGTTADCAGKCSAELYDLTRTRTCQNYGTSPVSQACSWITNANSGWGDCAGGPQQCGNGKKEGAEECDDGNSSDNDSCTNACKLNVCGDNKVNVGIESCDSGGANGTVCNAAYGASCNFCNKFCQYKTQSGPYCGDGVINGNEYCDGNDIPRQCFKADSAKCAGGTNAAGKASNGKVCDQSNPCGGDAKCGDQSNPQVAGTCSKQDEGKVGGQLGFECSISHTYCRPKGTCWDGTNPDVANVCTSSADCPNGGSCVNDSGCYGGYGDCVPAPKAFTGCDAGYTCRLVGSCNGGDSNGENGKLCTTGGLGWEYYPDNNKNYCDHTYTNGVDTGSGTCQVPVCGPNCGSTCPTAFQKVSLQVQGNVAESQPSSNINLYSFQNAAGQSPDRASILLPACRVGSSITADIATGSALLNTGNNAQIIAATKIDANGKYVNAQTQTDIFGIGNGIKLPLPTKFICHDVPFSLPFNVTLNPPAASSVSMKNFEFTYCPL